MATAPETDCTSEPPSGDRRKHPKSARFEPLTEERLAAGELAVRLRVQRPDAAAEDVLADGLLAPGLVRFSAPLPLPAGEPVHLQIVLGTRRIECLGVVQSSSRSGAWAETRIALRSGRASPSEDFREDFLEPWERAPRARRPGFRRLPRVLFVDDEVEVLEGLRLRLSPFRKHWEMEFSPRAEAALERAIVRPFDVIVSDWAMPGLDGRALLERVRGVNPGLRCIVLSGRLSADAPKPAADILLAKPCAPRVLEEAIQHALGA